LALGAGGKLNYLLVCLIEPTDTDPMTKRMILPLIFGIAGIAVLLSLGIWQVQRLNWKQTVLAEIEARIAADPAAIPANPDKDAHNRMSVTAEVTLLGPEAHVLTSHKFKGPGYLVQAPAKMADGRVVVLDMGFILEEFKDDTRPTGPFTVVGNMLWPNEVDGFTPDPNTEKNIWFARDAARLYAHFGLSPLTGEAAPFIVAVRQITKGSYPSEPVAIGHDIPNDHLGYAITWFSLAIVWFGMTGYLLWRIRQKTV
jgi:surfeit locus 1 family protein